MHVILNLILAFSQFIPSSLQNALLYNTPTGGVGYAFALGPVIVTAAHLVNEGPGQAQTVFAPLIKRIDMEIISSDSKKDLAFLRPSAEVPGFIQGTQPQVGEDVFYACIFPNDKGDSFNPILVKGQVVGEGDKVLLISGFGAPGCSGSPVVKADGTVVAVAVGVTYWGFDTIPHGYIVRAAPFWKKK